MSTQKSEKSHEFWNHHFNRAMTGNQDSLRKIVSDDSQFKVIIKEIYDERNRFRYDVSSQGIKCFIADVDYEVVAHNQDKQWPITKGEYTPGDYQVNRLNSFEDALIEAIDNHKFDKPKFKLVREPSLGAKVKIWIVDHYYDGQVGTILAKRPNGQYLVQLERKAPKRGRDEAGVAQMWVKADELNIIS